MPKRRMSDDERARDELDAHVRAIDWTPAALEYGSRERMLVASWLDATDLVYGEMRRLYPVEEQRETMTRWVTIRLIEKITGRPIESKSSQWNWDGLWDPTNVDDEGNKVSFCGWARRTSLPLAKWNARRVLKRRAIAASALEDEKGNNPAFDRASSDNALAPVAPGLFEDHPDLRVPRPAGASRTLLWGRLDAGLRAVGPGLDADSERRRAELYTALGGECRRLRLWDRSMDSIGLRDALTLLLAPLPDRVAPLMEGLASPWPMARAVRLYWPTQTARPRGDEGRLRREVSRVAQANDVLEWDVQAALGTMAARLIAS